MICTKKFLSSVAFVFLFSVFTVFGISPNTNAIEDRVITLSSSSDYPTFCDSSSPCNDYSYLIIEADSSVPNNSSFSLVANKLPSGILYTINFPLRSKYSVFKLENLISASNFKSFSVDSYQNFNSGVITLTFTSSFSSGITPEGSLEITENGTFDVTNYAEAVVNVPTGGDSGSGGSNYHDDLVSINNSIIICAGVALVIYFFYAIYRMFFKGVKS